MVAAETGSRRLRWLFERLLAEHGPQGWWPGRGPFEVAAGAVLVQATRWANARAALSALRGAGLEDARAVAAAGTGELERLLRPAGFFRQKARRLLALSLWLRREGGFEGLAGQETGTLRARLLALEGIGFETADCILLYACGRPVFVADAYARRLFARLGWWPDITESGGYEPLRQAVEAAAPADPQFLNELHALIVAHGKRHCRARPLCGACPLADRCPSAGRIGKEATGRRSSRH